MRGARTAMKIRKQSRVTALIVAALSSTTLLYSQIHQAEKGMGEEAQVYSVPCASIGNAIELTVSNASALPAEGITVTVADVPTWMHLIPFKHSLKVVSKESTVHFTFSIDKSAPVKAKAMLRLIVATTTGESWSKSLALTVSAPTEFKLFQNYPNPFNPETKIEYLLPEARQVRLAIYDVLGQEIRTLINDMEEAGYKSVDFDATGLSSGVYFYSLRADRSVEVRKMLISK